MMILKPLAALAIGLPTLAGLGVAATGVMVVDVREKGPNGAHIVVPVPLALARMALVAAPNVPVRAHGPGLPEGVDREMIGTADAVVKALAEAEDGVLVE